MDVLHAVYGSSLQELVSILLRPLSRKSQRYTMLLLIRLILKGELVRVEQLVLLQTGIDKVGRDDYWRVCHSYHELLSPEDTGCCKILRTAWVHCDNDAEVTEPFLEQPLADVSKTHDEAYLIVVFYLGMADPLLVA